MSRPPAETNRRLALPYLLPYAAYVGIASLPADWLSIEANYALRIAVVGGLLAWGWRSYQGVLGPFSAAGSIALGSLVGALGLVMWIALKSSLVLPGVEPWGETAWWLRLAASVVVVPVFEELAMRGYVLRFLVQWQQAAADRVKDPFGDGLDRYSIHDLAPGAATPVAVFGSSLVFMAGHGVAEYPAAFAYGLLVAALWIARKDLLSCIAAHAATNLLLALYVRATGNWELW
jgi:hypothetical protein